jgi:hypothetical protein
MTLRENPTDPFQRFLCVYPARDGGHDLEAARVAWDSAVRRADPEAIISGAAAYAEAMEGRERRYLMSARRWLSEARWRHVAAPRRSSDAQATQASRMPLVWVGLDETGWREWEAFWRATRGKTPPLDRKGGWRFPSRFPRAMVAEE